MTSRILFIIILLTLILGTPTAQASHQGDNDDVATNHVGVHWPSNIEWQMMSDINNYRAQNGLPRLEMSRSLAAAARHHSYYMSRTDDVDHSLGSVTWHQNLMNYGYPGDSCATGENVLAGRQSSGGALNLWISSESHRLNMLNDDWTRIGVGRVYYGPGRYDFYWTTLFGSCSHRTIYLAQAADEDH